MIKLTEHDWEIVQKQCKYCEHWKDEGCDVEDTAYPEPVNNCLTFEHQSFIEKEV